MNVGRYLRGEDRHVGTARTTQFQQPQHTWVGLTDEEMQSIAFESADALSAVFVAEAKLKAKNVL